jgi:coenzyme PQQ synthesis protein D (PqqD)
VRELMADTFVAAGGLETTALQEGAVLFHPKLGKFIMLNRSAAFLWSELATPKTEEELAQRFAANFTDAAPETSRQDVREALAKLRELELVSLAAA